MSPPDAPRDPHASFFPHEGRVSLCDAHSRKRFLRGVVNYIWGPPAQQQQRSASRITNGMHACGAAFFNSFFFFFSTSFERCDARHEWERLYSFYPTSAAVERRELAWDFVGGCFCTASSFIKSVARALLFFPSSKWSALARDPRYFNERINWLGYLLWLAYVF